MRHRTPNLLLVICDDLAYGDLHCHGNPWTRTPHLDRLHHEGTRLTRYCSGPVCTPARACLMTGRHAYRTRAIDTYLGRSTIDPEERTLAEVLRDAGYATGLFGKWHLGDTYPSRPHDKGFAEALYHTGGGLQQPGNIGRRSYFDPDLMHNGRLRPCRGYCTDIFADAALEFIDRHRAEPWFCYLATNAPHSPFEIGENWVEPYRVDSLPEKWARVYGMVENIDHNVGRLLAQLDRLGLAEDTIVLFTSDHGPCGSAMVDGQHRFNAGLRGFKGELYEGGVRVPCLLRYPRAVPAGRDLDRLAAPIDWLPTFAGACGARTPDDRPIDGADLWPLLRGTVAPSDWPDRTIGMQWHRGDVPEKFRNAALLGQRWKWYSPHQSGRDELYDITADPGETHDLAATHPELVSRLREAYEAWFEDVSSTRGAGPAENYAPPPIHLGSAHENPTALTWQDWRLYDPGHEGWSAELPGWWPVRIETTGEYRITVDLTPVAQPQTLVFRCGEASLERPLLPGLETTALERVTLAEGEARLECYQRVGDAILGVRYVYVEALSPS